MKRLLSSIDREGPSGASWALLILRVGVGALMLTHGTGKLLNYSEYAARFGDPIGLGGPLTLGLAVFAEFFCSIALIGGLFTRLSVLPLISTMLVAALIVHADDPFGKKELGLFYLLTYITILITGAGRFSLDYIILQKLSKPPE